MSRAQYFAGFVALLCLAGCRNENASFRETGERVGESLTDFAKGVGSGVDNRLEVPVELSDEVTQLGLSTTVAKSSGYDEHGGKNMTVYFLASQSVKSWIMAKALNAQDQEIGRSTVDVELAADDAKYVKFTFNREMDAERVSKYVLTIGKEPPKDTAKPAEKPAEPPKAEESARDS